LPRIAGLVAGVWALTEAPAYWRKFNQLLASSGASRCAGSGVEVVAVVEVVVVDAGFETAA